MRISTAGTATIVLALAAAVALSSCLRAEEGPARGEAIDSALASQCFKEAQAISDRDGGKMWGAPIYGPTLLLDEATREIAANRPDYKEKLALKGDIFVGTLPQDVDVENGSARYLGITWTVIRWPVPEDRFERDKLIIRESFRSIQEGMGLVGPVSPSGHLDTKDGRIWLQLEFRALRTALLEKKEARNRAVQDALLFRAYRRSLSGEAASREQALEMRQGVAEYTGVVLTSKDRAEAVAYSARCLAGAGTLRSFARYFAYITGPAYGLLLDESGPGWRKGLKASDHLGDLLAKACEASLPGDIKAAVSNRAPAYGGKELMAAEEKLDAKKREELAELRAKLVDGPVLILPTAQSFSYSFDPEDQVALEGWGTVYPFIRITSTWGVLEATRAALLVLKGAEIQGARVPAPKGAPASQMQGEGWKLELKEGWEVAPGQRPGDLEVRRAGSPQR